MKLYFRWKLFLGFFGFALVVAALMMAWLLLEVSRGHLFGGDPKLAAELRQWLVHFLSWALLVLGVVFTALAALHFGFAAAVAARRRRVKGEPRGR